MSRRTRDLAKKGRRWADQAKRGAVPIPSRREYGELMGKLAEALDAYAHHMPRGSRWWPGIEAEAIQAVRGVLTRELPDDVPQGDVHAVARNVVDALIARRCIPAPSPEDGPPPAEERGGEPARMFDPDVVDKVVLSNALSEVIREREAQDEEWGPPQERGDDELPCCGGRGGVHISACPGHGAEEADEADWKARVDTILEKHRDDIDVLGRSLDSLKDSVVADIDGNTGLIKRNLERIEGIRDSAESMIEAIEEADRLRQASDEDMVRRTTKLGRRVDDLEERFRVLLEEPGEHLAQTDISRHRGR